MLRQRLLLMKRPSTVWISVAHAKWISVSSDPRQKRQALTENGGEGVKKDQKVDEKLSVPDGGNTHNTTQPKSEFEVLKEMILDFKKDIMEKIDKIEADVRTLTATVNIFQSIFLKPLLPVVESNFAWVNWRDHKAPTDPIALLKRLKETFDSKLHLCMLKAGEGSTKDNVKGWCLVGLGVDESGKVQQLASIPFGRSVPATADGGPVHGFGRGTSWIGSSGRRSIFGCWRD